MRRPVRPIKAIQPIRAVKKVNARARIRRGAGPRPNGAQAERDSKEYDEFGAILREEEDN